MRTLFALLIAGLFAFPAQAAQQLTCIEEKKAISDIVASNAELALETEQRLTGVDARAIVQHHNANSPVKLDGDDWYVLILKVIHRPSGQEAPFKLVMLGRNGEVCRQGQLPGALIKRILSATPAA